jgi:hypothetical protein
VPSLPCREEMRTVIVAISGHPPGGNELHQMNRFAVSKSRLVWRQATQRSVVLPDGWTPLTYASLAVEWRYRVKRNRDLDNLVAGLKPVIDGLVSAGVIVDDHSGVLAEIGPLTVQIGCSRDETVLTVTERHE